jgi:hypothetical protein
MGKNRKQASLTNVVQYDSNFNLSIGTSTSSSFNSSGSIIAASGFTGSLSGSVFGLGNTVSFSSSVSSDLINLEIKSASVDISITNINSVTASNIARLSNLESKSSSVDISVSSLNTFSASNDNTSLNSKTGSYATTGSNTFFGTQTYSGSVYIANDLIVQGSSSIQYISASSVSIGTNIVQLNTANPSVRFAGLTIIDSGSIGGSGSFLYDSVHDEFLFVHRGNGTNITSSHFVLGPETYDSLGNETYLTCNIITKGTGKEHLVDSCIFDNGTTTCIKNNLVIGGTTCFQNNIAISGNLSFNVGASASNFAARDNCDTLIYSNTGKLKFTDVTGTSNYMTITPNGCVGIGTASPTQKLHLSDSTNGFVGLRLEGTGTYAGTDWIIYASSLSPSSADDFLGFYNNSTTDGATGGYKMSISKNGNVGINNTTTPCGRLQITLGTVAGGCFRTAAGGEAALTIEACGNSYMQFMNCSNSQTGFMFGNNCTAYSGMIWYRHNNKQLMLGAGGTETMYICGGNVGIAMSTPSQKLHLIGGFLQTAGNSSWYRNVFEVNPTSWTNVVGFSPQSDPQYTYGYINITASAYTNGTSAGGVTTSRWYYSITNNSISVSVNGSDIATGSQAPGVRLIVSSGTIYVQVQSNNGSSPAYTSVFVDAMLASGYINGTYWTIA